MKNIIIIMLVTISIYADNLKYISTGIGVYNAKDTDGGIDLFPFEIGIKNNTYKISLSAEHMIYIPKENEDDDLFLSNYSVGYDYFYYSSHKLYPYIGIAISFIDIEYTHEDTQNIEQYFKIGGNIKTGLSYNLNNTWDINLGIKYIYIGNILIKDTYGGFINFEFNF